MMQLAEVTIYDPTGVPLPVLTSSSDCDFNSGETSTEALDGNPFSKWRCGNEDATLNIEFDSSQVVGSYTLTTADDHPERDPTSWTLYGREQPSDIGFYYFNVVTDQTTWERPTCLGPAPATEGTRSRGASHAPRSWSSLWSRRPS